MYRNSFKIKIFFKKRFYLYFSPIKANTTVLRGMFIMEG